jgi:hypothetical protein
LRTKKNLARRKQKNFLFPLLQRIERLHGKLALNYMERKLIRRLRSTVRVKCFELSPRKKKKKTASEGGERGFDERETRERLQKQNKTK